MATQTNTSTHAPVTLRSSVETRTHTYSKGRAGCEMSPQSGEENASKPSMAGKADFSWNFLRAPPHMNLQNGPLTNPSLEFDLV